MKERKFLSPDEALEKLKRYCAYQDRCHQEVRYKILEYGVFGDDLEELISALIQDDFLNEERFARSYVRGKFRFKKWGRNKIIQNLKNKQVSPYCIKKGLEEIEEEEYVQNIKDTIIRRVRTKSYKSDYQKRQDIIRYLMSKGFEYETIVTVMNNEDQ